MCRRRHERWLGKNVVTEDCWLRLSGWGNLLAAFNTDIRFTAAADIAQRIRLSFNRLQATAKCCKLNPIVLGIDEPVDC